MKPSEVFLSHSSNDAAFVTAISNMLGRHGVPFWYSKTNILGAQQWHDEIGAALGRCDWFVLVLPSFQTVDFATDFDAGCRELLRMWGIGYVP